MRGSPEPEAITARVVEHYRRHRRDLPWRRSRDPYAIWVSEIMLQQTRVAAAIPYYERWLRRFPTVAALAEAPQDDVLAAWTGLGYYRRARNLHRAAREVVARHGGAVPGEVAALRSLPGIGRYTAGAIASIAFGRAAPLVDGNVARVLARLFELEGSIRDRATEKELWRLAAELVPEDAPGDFNQGLMELGATICTPTRPSCLTCPLAEMCRARRSGRQDELPVMPARSRAEDRPLLALHAAWIERRGKLLLARRRDGGLYGGLWELPQCERQDALAALVGLELGFAGVAPVFERRQVLSHRRLVVSVWPARASGRARLAPDHPVYDQLRWHALGEVDALGISSATRAILRRYQENDAWQTKTSSSSSPRATRRSSRGSSTSATARTKTKTSTAPPGARRGASRS